MPFAKYRDEERQEHRSNGRGDKPDDCRVSTVITVGCQPFCITDQSQVVGDSVDNFLHELLVAIIAVIIVVMLLLPMRVALVAASTIPITIFISLGLFHAFDIELNTVTLAALIVTLGMIVDNSIVIIDSYLEKLGEGVSRWHASIQSATHFFKSIFSATCAISITFSPSLSQQQDRYRIFWLVSLGPSASCWEYPC